MLEYTPSIVGVSSAAVIFHNNDCGEFWIELLLKAVKPEIVNVPIIEAELGSSKITKIVLNNPTDEMYILKPKITNTDVFKLQLATSAKQLANITSPYLLETDNKNESRIQMSTICQYPNDDLLHFSEDLNYSSQLSLTNRSISSAVNGTIKLKPKSMLSLGLKFTPCDIGETEHQGSIVFYSEKLTEWCFTLCGKGLMPEPRDPINVSVLIGSATTLVVPITNPFKYDVLLDIHLSESTLCGLFKQLEDTHNAILKKKFNNVPPNSNDDDSKDNIKENLVEANECNCDDDHDHDKSFIKAASKPINGNVYSAFQLLVKQKKNILLTSKKVFEIPISFAPLEMREHEALCTVRMYKANSAAHDLNKTATSISPIRWLVPIKVSLQTCIHHYIKFSL
ncbi:unnamed protein product [Trichobilharzia regenti]|nr:unnamed protein product [Trichobilharzia regenti]